MKYVSKSISKTEEIAEDFLNKIKSNKDQATVVGLYGNLGSGKTTFTQIVAKKLGIKEKISSPTFVIEKIYKLKTGALKDFEHLIHIDCYRLNNEKETLNLGFNEIIENPKNLIFIEWPEKISGVMPEHQKINFEFVDEHTRSIEIKNAKC